MQTGQIITLFSAFLCTLALSGCLFERPSPKRILTIFIDDGRFEELSCGSTVTSHPRSGIRLLCHMGAIEVEYEHGYKNLSHALSDWLHPQQVKIAPKLYYENWSTQLFPSSPDLIIRSHIEIGFETILDSFPIRDGLWHQNASTIIEALLQFESAFNEKSNKYQVMTLSDLAFHWSKKTSEKGFELSQGREQSWEAIDGALYQLLTTIGTTSDSSLYQVAVMAVSRDESIGSGLIYSKNLDLQKSLSRSFSLKDLSAIFHQELLPKIDLTLRENNLSSLESAELEESPYLPVAPFTGNHLSPELRDCLNFKSCPALEEMQRWIRQIIDSKNYRRLQILKSATEGFYLNEALGNPFHMNDNQKAQAILLLKAISEFE